MIAEAQEYEVDQLPELGWVVEYERRPFELIAAWGGM